MFSRVKGFLSRHRRKFIITGIVVGSVVFATRLAQRKFREWQERETKEFLERTRRQQHFESTERTCNQTILSLAPTVGEAVTKTVNTEEIVNQLREGHPNKVALWEELKTLAFTRAAVLVYAGAMLVVTLRIQLNLIGGYMFRDSSEMAPGSSHISNVLQQKYLSLCHHFMNHGVGELCSLVQNKIKYIMGGISLKDKLNLHDTEQTFWAVQAAISSDSSDPVKNMIHYIIPPDQTKIVDKLSAKDAEMLNTMLVETIDILESDEVRSLLSSLVSRGFSHVVDRIAEYFVPNDYNKSSLNTPTSAKIVELNAGTSQIGTSAINDIVSGGKNGSVQKNGIGPFIHPNNVSIAMAKLIPIVNGLVHHAGRIDVPDPWIQQLILEDKVKILGANVYESFSNKS